VLVSSHRRVANALEGLGAFASILGRNLGIRMAGEGDGVAADFLDARLQDGVRGDSKDTFSAPSSWTILLRAMAESTG
jgi:hypothetical protein